MHQPGHQAGPGRPPPRSRRRSPSRNSTRSGSPSWSAKHGTYRPEDALALWNFRKLNERFKSRFDVFAKVAATPIRKSPKQDEIKTTALAPTGSNWTWAVPLWAGLAIVGLTWLGGTSRRPS